MEVVTLWSTLALADVPDLSDAGIRADAKARTWLKANQKPTNNTETLLLRSMLAAKDGEIKRSTELLAELLKLQHADGGWGWLQDRPKSDPFTTSIVLDGLTYLGRDATDPAIQKAGRYLLNAEGDDGV